MNMKALVIPVLLLTFVLISIPVMGAPATKVGVTATVVMTTIPVVTRDVDHGIMLVREGISFGTVTLDKAGQKLIGNLNGEWIGMVKWHSPEDGTFPEAEALIMSKHEWTFTGEGTTGTFEGVVHSKWIGFPPPVQSHIEYHMVLQGTGDFEGQTLKLSYEGAPPAVLEGCLVIPN